jgi:hypothetical protein
LASWRRIADAVKVKVGSRNLAIALILVSTGGMALLLARSGTRVFQAAATPDWRYLLAGLAICAAVQPLRALAWTSTGELRRLLPRHRPAGTHGRGLEGRGA